MRDGQRKAYEGIPTGVPRGQRAEASGVRRARGQGREQQLARGERWPHCNSGTDGGGGGTRVYVTNVQCDNQTVDVIALDSGAGCNVSQKQARRGEFQVDAEEGWHQDGSRKIERHKGPKNQDRHPEQCVFVPRCQHGCSGVWDPPRGTASGFTWPTGTSDRHGGAFSKDGFGVIFLNFEFFCFFLNFQKLATHFPTF